MNPEQLKTLADDLGPILAKYPGSIIDEIRTTEPPRGVEMIDPQPLIRVTLILPQPSAVPSGG
jgi:hypothetical protein